MYKRIAVLYNVIALILFSCDGESKRIIGDFSFWRDGLESTAAITYRSQGIIDTTAYVVDYWNDNNYIVAKTFWYRKKPTEELRAPYYYLIDLERYREKPHQLKSNAVAGPFLADSLVFYIQKKDLSIDPSYLSLLE